MAERVGEEFPTRRGRGPSIADLQRWASEGGVWRLERGVDFDCSMESLRGTLGHWTSSNGYRLESTTKMQPDGVLLVRFTPKDER